MSPAARSPKASEPLREPQHERCFYCERSLPAAAAVDHFIPWSRYPRDLAHNLVPAHGACNSRTSDQPARERDDFSIELAANAGCDDRATTHSIHVPGSP